MTRFLFFIYLLTFLYSYKSYLQDDNEDPEELYNDEKNKIYINEHLEFSLKFNYSWRLFSEYKFFPANIKNYADSLQQKNSKLIMFGLSRDSKRGIRIIAEECNINIDQYFKLLKKVNKTMIISNNSYKKIIINNNELIEWIYTASVSGEKYIYTDYIINNKKITRISFWTKKPLFDKYYIEFFKIIQTLSD